MAQHPRWKWEKALRAADVSATAKLVGLLIATYANKNGACYPSVATLAKHAQASERTVRRATRELVEAGLLEKKQRGMDRSNAYWLSTIVDKELWTEKYPDTGDHSDLTPVTTYPDTGDHYPDTGDRLTDLITDHKTDNYGGSFFVDKSTREEPPHEQATDLIAEFIAKNFDGRTWGQLDLHEQDWVTQQVREARIA